MPAHNLGSVAHQMGFAGILVGAFGESAQAIEHRLAPSLVEFLKRAHDFEDVELQHSWFYYVPGLTTPDRLFELEEMPDMDGENDDGHDWYILLYSQYTPPTSHPLGILFDHVNFAALMVPSLWDLDIATNDRTPWTALETLLDASAILDRTLTAFCELICAINVRRPSLGATNGWLAAEADLDSAGIHNPFIREFLIRAPAPDFTFIAPVIAIQTPTQMADQPYKNIPNRTDVINPTLLFRGESIVAGLGGTFSSPFKEIIVYPSGLYSFPFRPEDENAFADGVSFILPYQLGAAGFARASDRAPIGKRIDFEESARTAVHDSLFSAGYNSFIGKHPMQLYRVLEHWTKMILAGVWEVGENGVEGGIEKFREADTAERWECYAESPLPGSLPMHHSAHGPSRTRPWELKDEIGAPDDVSVPKLRLARPS
ncbi:hypothetical protein EJ06DRAFT_566109 [Trichodelitschia bisporula]|uniref:Uncharacterized protein n=1 Tax=Trichodelitschia bisporula TaxID=703511 RepID=A0A6G1HQ02_9PEZI|nr:hypothetical protein EJ06DRAFT_566109 [Trichodelitschia bisporula]